MRVLLSSNPYRDRGLRVALEARRILNNAGAETALCLPFAPRKGDRLDLPRQVKLGSMEEELKRADVLLCFGGDGTILHAARDATLHDLPILGVNMGSVGFMAELERSELNRLVQLAKGDYTIQDFKLPIFHFLQRFCGIYPYLDLTDVRPAAADAALAEIFQVPMGTPLLNMEEVDYDIDGRPVFCSSEYFVDGIFRHTVMRKKL